MNRHVAQNLLVHQTLHLLDFGTVHRGVVREIEPQPGGLHHAAGLLDVLPEHLAQRGMQQVCGGVIAHCGARVDVIHARPYFVTHAQGPDGRDAMHRQAGQCDISADSTRRQ